MMGSVILIKVGGLGWDPPYVRDGRARKVVLRSSLILPKLAVPVT